MKTVLELSIFFMSFGVFSFFPTGAPSCSLTRPGHFFATRGDAAQAEDDGYIFNLFNAIKIGGNLSLWQVHKLFI